MRIPLSKEWTAEDRLRVVAAMLPGIRDDIQNGRYSKTGRPNITSLEHIIHEEPSVLECFREECEEAVEKHERLSLQAKQEWLLNHVATRGGTQNGD